jgi:protein TonB
VLKEKRTVKAIVVTLVLAFALVGSVSPPAFCQANNQQEVARKVKTRIEPTYPPLARQLNLSGKVKIEVTVSPDGRVTNARTLGGNPVLAGAAVDAVKTWKYEAGSKETVEVVELVFKGLQK